MISLEQEKIELENFRASCQTIINDKSMDVKKKTY